MPTILGPLHCCKIGCGKPAEYDIWARPKPDDYVHSCLEHTPDLITDAKRHEIIALDEK